MLNRAVPLLLLGPFIFLASVVAVHANPTIVSVSAYTDNRAEDDPFNIPGYKIALSVSISDPGGVPANIRSVTARNTRTNELVNIPFASNEAPVHQGLYLVFLSPLVDRLGTWEFTVVNHQNQTDQRNSHPLDRPVLLPLPTYVSLENFPGSPSNPPRVLFDPVPNADSYNLEIYQDASPLPIGLWQSPNSPNPRFDIPFDKVKAGQRYVFRARAVQLAPIRK